MSNFHVYPKNDLAPYNTDSNICPCNPTIDKKLIIHNSFDGREKKELINEVIKKYLILILSDYKQYLAEDKKLEKDSIRIRLRSVDELEKIIEEW